MPHTAAIRVNLRGRKRALHTLNICTVDVRRIDPLLKRMPLQRTICLAPLALQSTHLRAWNFPDICCMIKSGEWSE
jgi:hypothetical protein